MAKVELTQAEIALIDKHLSGEYNPFFAPVEEQTMLNSIIERAEALEEELNAYDETTETDLLKWYKQKYDEQLALN
jgi:hypothetical protein